MGKNKVSRKKGLADKVRTKKSAGPAKVNPFEVKVNTQKHNVLGKKPASYDRGRPGIARSKAIKKRKETLLVEYKKRGKVNKVVDRRFGETDPELSLEDKMLQRFAMERQKGHDKSSNFNLNEDEELTHFGQTLSQIEKFDDPQISDDDEDDTGKLDGDIVAEEHFGGFLTKKKQDGEEQQKTWKERMEEIIVRSKKQKYERQSEKEKRDELTEKLDQDWKTLMESFVTSKRTKDTATSASKSDDYDIIVRELRFESKGKATDRLKTEEEIAKEEQEKLEKLEADRLRRMKGISEEEDQLSKIVYRSADDLDDDFSFGKKGKNVSFEVAYKNGALLNDNSDEEDEEDQENSDEDDDDENKEEDSDSEEGSEDGMDDSASDLDSDESVEDEDRDVETIAKNTPKGILKGKMKVVSAEPLTTEQKADKLKKTAALMDSARRELPYTFPAPQTYEDLLGLLKDHGEREQLVIIDRLQKLYHPSLAEGNKEKLQTLYALLVQYCRDLSLQDPPLLNVIDLLIPTLYSLTQRFPEASAAVWASLIHDQWEEFSDAAQRRVGRGTYPALDVLLMFKVIGVLFPTSDYRHPVVTPTTLLMGHILSQSTVTLPLDVASGLLLCGLFLQYTNLSKRFVPEVINFLHGILFLASTKSADLELEKVPPPFKPVGKHVDLIKLSTPCKKCQLEALSLNITFSSEGCEFLDSDKFKVNAMYQCLGLLSTFLDLYEELPSVTEIFDRTRYFGSRVNFKNYPKAIRESYSKLIEKLDSLPEKYPKNSLVRQKARPKPLQMFEPKFDEVFDGRKKRVGSREKQEKERLVHRYKKEMKGAIRNLRQDNQFLAREKLNETMERDAERKRKVKELFADLAQQEGDYKALKRLKEKAK